MARVNLVLGLAVVGIVGWLLWLWLSRARRVALTSQQAKAHIERERARPGALPSGAIEVSSSATIEPQVERVPCSFCGGAMHVVEHEVEEHGGDRLRRADARCGSCSQLSTTWFRVRAALPN